MSMNPAMIIAASVAGASAQQLAATGQTAEANPQSGQNGGAFGRMLVAQVSDAGGAVRQDSQTQAAQRIACQLSSGEWADLLGGATGKSLFDKLDALLQLTENGAEPLTEEQKAEIDAALEELQAVMMAMFGIPLPLPNAGQAEEAPVQPADMAAEADTADGVAFRGGLHETIAFVRAFLAEGAFRPLTRQESARFEALIDRLQQALTAADEANRDAAAEARQTVDIKTTGTETRSSAEALLARLARPMQASVAAVVTEAQRQSGVQTGTVQTAALTGANVNGPAANAQLQTIAAEDAVQAAAAETADLTPITQAVGPQSASAAAETARTEAAVRQPVHTVPVERFHEVISGMAVRQMNLSASNGVSEARILLVPEHLGEVAVRITLQNGQLTAQFMTESAVAKDLIENQFVVLRGALQSQGIQVERLEVTYGNAAQSQMFQEQRQRGGQNRQEGGRGNRADDSVPVFETELLEQTAIRELGYGRAINVKA
ncbi:flagellar hook-length control protein [Thermobacillus composti KWC4]|uniref:Flagellar hook-length control protein n=1 Tax=Thermobacillus composti (strain DSM 18247 / JCM 13945 / KWC4) TaxID=717605 RepID=L0EEV4_THECK|nr:flagellar hook-length control protein FliK [Thermobacillus composti]AGA58221.1 flagellar hook-length control protein [Thermobacillus composti KWC4]